MMGIGVRCVIPKEHRNIFFHDIRPAHFLPCGQPVYHPVFSSVNSPKQFAIRTVVSAGTRQACDNQNQTTPHHRLVRLAGKRMA